MTHKEKSVGDFWTSFAFSNTGLVLSSLALPALSAKNIVNDSRTVAKNVRGLSLTPLSPSTGTSKGANKAN